MTLNQLIKDATEISHKYTTGDIPLVIYGTEVDIVLTEQGDNGKYHIEVNCVPTPKEKSTLPGDCPLADTVAPSSTDV